MSKDFDSTLCAALDLAAAATRTSGASAARIRGRKRTMRKRVAVSTVSAVLVATGVTAAFKITSSHGGTPQLTTTSSQVTATAGQSSGATSRPNSGPPSSGPAVTADPHQAVQGAWLTAAQLPFASLLGWKPTQSDQGAGPIGQPLTPTVFYVAKDTTFQGLTACADPTSLLGRTIGAQHTEYTTVKSSTLNASQFVFFFADATTAQQAFTWLQSQYGPSCQADSGLTATKTAGDGQTSAAWLLLADSSASMDVPQYSREYFVLRGSTIAYVSVTDAVYRLTTTNDDAAQLSIIAAHLCVYGGPCK